MTEIPAVVYGAKSSDDPKASLPAQLQDGREAAEREGQQVMDDFRDEAKSAFKGNRGQGLTDAKDAAIRLAAEHGACELWVQHSDRLARGDGITADHLAEVWFALRRHGVRLRSVQDDSNLDDAIRVVLIGERNHEDSKRKALATRRGLASRRDGGKPVGRIPLGFTWEHVLDAQGQPVYEGGRPVTHRIIDPATSPVIERIFAMVESGSSFGDVARRLNAEGIVGKRGKPWVSRTVRNIVLNDVYAGRRGYPAIIDPDRWQRVQEGLTRLDPAAVQRRKGGRRPTDDAYILRGVAFCTRCNAALYTRHQAAGRMYVCANRRQGTGMCDAVPIPAALIESHVMQHLDVFVGSVEAWLNEQAHQRTAEHEARVVVVKCEQTVLADLDRQREQLMAEYRRMVADEDALARYGLEEVGRIDQERQAQQEKLAEAEAVEWTGPPDVDAALSFYNGLLGLVQGRVKKARGALELNQALSTVLTGLWCEMEPDRDRLLVEFELREPGEQRLVGGAAILPELRSNRLHLPPARPGTPIEPRTFSGGTTGTHTLV